MNKTLFLGCLLCSTGAFAQNELDKYFDGHTSFTEIGNKSHKLSNPQDLDFVPSRPNEWWVVNKEAGGGSVVIFFDAGKSTQSHQFRRDSHHAHFMPEVVAIAFGDNDYFVTAQEIKSTAGPASTFMGPALWSSDTSIFARMHQSNWDPAKLLGSHIDMLHQSPYGMGVAHDQANVYWYFDGYSGNICRYDFAAPHGVGEDDHSDGIIHRYTEASVTRKKDIPSHLALDKANKWLYIVDGGGNRIIRLKTDSGTPSADIPVPSSAGEPLAEYKEITGATVEVLITSGFQQPSGIDYRNGRIIVSDYGTGDIMMYDVTTPTPTLVGKLITGGPGVMGVRIDDNNRIWYVNKTTRKLMRIDNPNVLGIADAAKTVSYSVYPNPASGVVNISLDEVPGTEAANIRIFDISGKLVHQVATKDQLTKVNTASWAKGVYTISVSYKDAGSVSRVVVQ